MFFEQLDIGDGHAAIDRLEHVVDGEEGDLDGGKGFHFDASGPDGFDGGDDFKKVI